MPTKLTKNEIMKIMNNEMKKNSLPKSLETTPGGSYVLNRKKGGTAKKPLPPTTIKAIINKLKKGVYKML